MYTHWKSSFLDVKIYACNSVYDYMLYLKHRGISVHRVGNLAIWSPVWLFCMYTFYRGELIEAYLFWFTFVNVWTDFKQSCYHGGDYFRATVRRDKPADKDA